MGIGKSVFTQREVDIYKEMTKLNEAEINHAYSRFKAIDPLGGFDEDKKGRISFVTVAEQIKEFEANPFKYRICKLFCASEDGYMNFDDFLHVLAMFSEKASQDDKVVWAFRLYDFNEDNSIDADDLDTLLDVLTGNTMEQDIKDEIIQLLLEEADSDGDEAISFEEFERQLSFSHEFFQTFQFKLV